MDRPSALRLVTGSKHANRTTGYVKVKLNGPTNGHLKKSPWGAVERKNADASIMTSLIVNMAGQCEGSVIGLRAYLIKEWMIKRDVPIDNSRYFQRGLSLGLVPDCPFY